MITIELLEALLSSDLSRRSQAEEHFQSLSVRDRVQGLMQLVPVASASIQILAPVLLRRDILKLADAALLIQLINPLLASFPGRPHVGHCLSEVCATLSLMDETSAETALRQVLASIQPAVQQGDATSIRFLADLADRAPASFRKVATAEIPSMFQSHPNADTMEAWTHVLVNAAVATTIQTPSLARETPNLDDLRVDPSSPAAQVLGPCMNNLLQLFHTIRDDRIIQSCLEHLARVSVHCPSLLAGNAAVLDRFVQTCLQQMDSSSSAVQLSALEAVTSFLSVGAVKRQCVNREMATAIAGKTIPVCAHLMATISDEDEWASEPATLVEDVMEDGEEESHHSESLLSCLLQQLGGVALTVALPLVQQLLSSQECPHQRAGLAMLECGILSTPLSLVSLLPLMMQASTSKADSPNIRVQWQAIRLLGILGETVDRAEYAQSVLQKLATALSSRCTKVSAMASLGIVSFCRGSGEAKDVEDAARYVQAFLPELLGALVSGPLSCDGMDVGSITVRVRAMGAVACLAESSGEAFVPYYGKIMPGLLASVQLPAIELAGAAVEAATIVGKAVGLENFRNHANQLLQWILPALRSRTSAIPLEQLLSACARMAFVLEEEFAPYVDVVLPILLERANEPADVSLTEADESGLGAADETDDSFTVALPGKGFTKVTINTTAIQEKLHAIRAAYEHAKALGASYGPYVQMSMDVFLPLLQFPYSADVRSTSAQTLAAVFEAACAASEDSGVMNLPQKYFPILAATLAKQIEEEDSSDMESLYALSDALSEILYIVYQYRNNNAIHREIVSHFSLDHAQELVKRCMKAMIACLERRASITNILGGALTGEDEQQEYLALLKAEEVLLTPLVDSVGYTLKVFRSEFVPIFESLVVPTLGPMLSSTNDAQALHSALCLFVDCVEHCGKEAASRHANQLLGAILGVVSEGSTAKKELLQPAVYGIAQISRYAPGCLTPQHIQTFVHTLLALTDCSKEEAGDNTYLVEVAVSALASITLFGPGAELKSITKDALVTRFLDHLPIQQDEDEAKICHAGLCHLIESQAIDLGKNATRITQIIGHILSDVGEGEEVASPETCEKLVSILKVMGDNLPEATMQQAFSALEPEAQQAINVAVYRTSAVVTP